MGKQVDLEEMIAETETIEVPEYFFYADLSLSALGLVCSIHKKQQEIEKIAEEQKITFDEAVIALYSKTFRYEFKNAMNELIAAELYTFEDEKI